MASRILKKSRLNAQKVEDGDAEERALQHAHARAIATGSDVTPAAHDRKAAARRVLIDGADK